MCVERVCMCVLIGCVCVDMVRVLIRFCVERVCVSVVGVTDEALDGSVCEVEDDVLTHPVLATRLQSKHQRRHRVKEER